MIGWLRIVIGLFLLVVGMLLVAIFQPIALKTGLWHEKYIPRWWHRLAAKVLGIRIHRTGSMAEIRPLLLAANHVSWVDIIALGAAADVYFVAKADMAKWPGIGWLCKMQRTVFVERERRGRSGDQVNEIGARLAAGDPMVLFAEGTTSDGNLLKPFNSTLFGAAKMALAAAPEGKVFIQPVAIAYTRLHGMPLGRDKRGHVAWIGDQDLLPHVVTLLRDGALDAEVRFGEPVEFNAASKRKEAAQRIEENVREMFVSAIRDPRPSKPPHVEGKALSRPGERR
ncbi:MAG: 1-acyl-sn-glycerol-3-phosphate acyltransferase [Rhizobiales bacterium 65-79]|jgi:1-acyl-sn-glycerol-3-phosphate acyltransferase|nr:1-acyl-sn-glycerol-3-phosphate acyltransferase [Hyphomicrobiales bacterium]OJU01603.1 MAG: 1-acyl-sn-glycerol-3-phosphate acyltransferase [Rhizobiales bacterium 65-79]